MVWVSGYLAALTAQTDGQTTLRLKKETNTKKFVVTPTGEVTDFNVINSVSPEIDKEVIRVLQTTSGMWIPASNNGKPVAIEKEISVAKK